MMNPINANKTYTNDEKLGEQKEVVNRKFLRKFLKLRKLCLRMQKQTPFWKSTAEHIDQIKRNVDIFVAQGGSVMSQSLSDRVESMFKELSGMNYSQMNFSIPMSHSLTKDSKSFVTTTINDSVNGIRRISSEAVSTIKEVFETFLSRLTTTFQHSSEIFNVTMKLIKFLAVSYAAFYLVTVARGFLGTTLSAIATAILYMVVLNVTDHAIREFLTRMYNIYVNDDRLLAQAGEEDVSFLSYFIPPLFLEATSDTSSGLFKKIWKSKDFDLIVKRLSYFGDAKIFNAFDNIGTWLTTIINRTVNYVKVTVLGHDPEEFLENQGDPLLSWEEQCRAHFVSDTERIAIYTDSTLSDIKRLYNMGVAYLRHPLYKEHKRAISELLNQLLKFADKIKKRVGADASVRNPPVTLYLYGETGVGKSTLTYPLCATLLKAIFEKEKNKVMLESLKTHYKEMIYVRAAEQEYWDGYTQQLVTVFDDFNQQVDSPSNPCLELFEIIRASNIFPYPLHMASIEDKANTTFQSKVILCSSNNKVPKTESLNYPKALLRRFAKFVEVKRVPSEDGKFTTDTYTFVQYDPFDQCKIIKSMDFDELIDELLLMYFEEGEFVDSVDQYIMTTIFAQNGHDSDEFFDCRPSTSSIATSEEPLPRMNDILRQAKCKCPLCKRNLFMVHNNSPKIIGAINDLLQQEEYEQSYQYLLGHYFAAAKESIQTKYADYRQKYHYTDWLTFSKTSKIVLGIMSLILIGFGIYSYVKRDKNPSPEAYETKVNRKLKVEGYNERNVKKKVEAYDPKVNRTLKVESDETKINGTSLIEKDGEIVVSEGCSDINASEQLTSVTTNNTYVISVVSKGKIIRVGHCIFLKGKIAVAPGHYLRVFQKMVEEDNDAIVQFNHPFGKRNFFTYVNDIKFSLYKTKNLAQVNDNDSRDLMHFIIDKAIIHKDITSFFSDRFELRAVGSTQIQLPVMRWHKDNGYIFVKMSQGTSSIRNVTNVTYATDNQVDAKEIRLREAWEYSLETTFGDCGAPLFVTNSKIGPGKIIGIHTAGGTKFGVGSCYATPFYTEDVKEILAHYDFKAQACAFEIVVRQGLVACDVPEHLSHCELVVMGKIDDPPIQPTRSKISPSPLYGEITEPITAPTWLYPRELDGKTFDPLRYRTERMGKESVPLRIKPILLAKQALIDDIYSIYLKKRDLLDGRFPSSYSFDTAVLGIPGEDFVNSIKRDTSCGFPFVKEGWTRAKIFGNEEIYDLNTPGVTMLRSKVNECISSARQGKVLDHYFIDTLKDERKPIHKAHKTRMFSNGPIDYLIWSKMYFNPIVAVLSELRNIDHISVGSNVYSRDWDEIARYLKSKSPFMVAGDFEGFDASEQSDILYAAGDVLIELSKKIFQSSDDEIIQQRAIMHSLVNSLHINENGLVLQWCKSLPSGHYLTAIVNSIFVNLVMCLAFMEAKKSYTFVTATTFYKECGIVAYGDDHVVSVPEKFLDVFNQQTLPILMRKFGMFYTIETKDDTEVNFLSRPLEEVSYLKRKFIYDQARQRYIAPLSLEVILEMPMWTKSSKDINLNVFQNAEHALRELSLHDEETWKEWQGVLHSKCEEKLRQVSSLKFQDEVREITLGLQGYE